MSNSIYMYVKWKGELWSEAHNGDDLWVWGLCVIFVFSFNLHSAEFCMQFACLSGQQRAFALVSSGVVFRALRKSFFHSPQTALECWCWEASWDLSGNFCFLFCSLLGSPLLSCLRNRRVRVPALQILARRRAGVGDQQIVLAPGTSVPISTLGDGRSRLALICIETHLVGRTVPCGFTLKSKFHLAY